MLASSRAGWPPMVVLAAPGDQGPAMAGMQGAGVGVPMAAAVAAATTGLDWVVHMIKLARLTMGLLSWMLAAGTLQPATLLVGRTTSEQGPVPIEH